MDLIKRINKVYESSERIYFDDNSKFILMSDCHRGDGNWTDNFSKNQNIFFAALSHYYDNNYIYIELGDGDELWEVPKYYDIIQEHSDIFWLMTEFYKDNRLYLIYGNHDMNKKDADFVEDNLYYFFKEREERYVSMFKDIKIHEGLILVHRKTKQKIFLIHGHQVDVLNSTFWKLSRFLVRYLWTPLESIGFRDRTRTAKNYGKKKSVGRRLSYWAETNDHILIAGHNHRPMFPKEENAPYFNDGSCVHPRCITGIEIVGGSIMLVKWSIKTKGDGLLYIGKDILAGPRRLEDYLYH